MTETNRDPRCVYIADTAADAIVVASYLNNAGVPAQALGLEAGAVLPPAAVGEVEVWVDSLNQVDVALRLLEEHDRIVNLEAARKQAIGPVNARCEECGEVSEFPGEQLGTTQTCPKCGAYMDVIDVSGSAAP
jgi:Zn finger protein HypA/HybF involved in hydrogenase expression